MGPFTHKRSHGGKSSPQLVAEAAALHKRICAALVECINGKRPHNQTRRLLRLSGRAYTRFCRREVRLEIQRERGRE